MMRKRLFLIIIPILTIIILNIMEMAKAGEIKTQVIKPVAYRYSVEPISNKNSRDDKEHTILTNGVKGSSENHRPIWECKRFNNKTLSIEFDFNLPTKFDEAKIYYYRHRNGFGIKKITIYGITPDGARKLLGGISPNQPYKAKVGYARFDISLDSEIAVSKTIVEIQGISRLALTEIEFLGKTIVAEAPVSSIQVPKNNPFDKLGNDKRTGLVVVEKDFTGDGSKEIILENDQMLYVLEPACGGVVNYAFDKKSGNNLVKLRTRNNWGGVFSDCVLPGKSRSDWSYSSYNYEILERGPEKARVKLRLNGSTGSLRGATFEKTYILYKNNAALKVNYRFINGKENVIPIEYGLWFHSGMGSEKEKFDIFYTTPGGVKSQPSGKQLWNYNSTRGWSGIVTESGKGCAILHDYKYLQCHYFWSEGGKHTTVETRFGKYPVNAGESLNTTAWLIPFYGIGVPDGVSPYLTGRFVLKDKYPIFPGEFKVTLKPSMVGDYNVIVDAKRLPDGEWIKLFSENRKLTTDPTDIGIKFSPGRKGSYVFRLRSRIFGEDVFEMETPVIIGEQSGDYNMMPISVKLPVPGEEKKEKDNLDYNSLDFVTKHVNWAKPFAGKKPKVLFLSRKRGGIRDGVEVAERFEMDFDNSYISGCMSHGMYDLAAFYAKVNKSLCFTEINELLRKNRYDCIVISSDLWRYFGAQIKDKILNKVKKGTGLVLVAPEYLPEELASNFRLPSDAKRIKGVWKVEREHFITTGIPFNALPQTLALPYSGSSEVLAIIDKKPLIGIFHYGKGRVAAASWSVGGRKRTGSHAINSGRTFLPNLLYIGVGGIQYDYWEYQLSILAKMIYWTAHCEPAVCGKKISVIDGKRLSLEIDSIENEILTAELIIRDKFYRTEQRKKTEIKVSSGINKRVVEFEKPVLGGIHFADVIIKSSKGVEWWGSASFNIDNDIKICGILSERQIWKKADTFRCKIKTDGENKGKTIKINLIDNFGRLFAQTEKPLDACEQEVSISLKESLGLLFTVQAFVCQGDKTLAENRKQFILYGIPDADKLQISFGWPQVGVNGYHRFIIKDYWGILKNIGATSLRGFHTDTRFEILQARELNMATRQSPPGATTGGAAPFLYRNAREKLKLIRKPCLSDPKIQSMLKDSNAKGSWQDKWGSLCRSGPDEANSSIKTWDGCFSEHCQKQFREWLKTEYSNLAVLNKEWATNYSDWDQVVAMTADEVKKHKSYAPWHDHRTFNEWNWARSLASITNSVKRIAPHMHYSLSGTQETNACNAWDWYRLSKSLDAFEAYNGEQSVMRRCFGKNLLCYPWIGYVNERLLSQGIISSLFMGASGFTVFNGRLCVNPDFTLPRISVALKNAFGQIKDGKAEVIMHSEYKSCPVAFLYSPASIKINFLLDKFASYEAEVRGLKTLLGDIGGDYDYIAYRQLEEGSLLQDKYKILFMPLSVALSDREMKSIEDFVRTGGIVISDMASGTFTQHGASRDIAVLDKVFGITRNRARIVDENVTLKGISSDGLVDLSNFNIPVTSFETGITPATGKVLAAIKYRGKSYPACIVNKYGKGYVLYFACNALSVFGSWNEMRFFKKNLIQVKVFYDTINSLLQRARITIPIKVVTESGTGLPATQCYLRRNGPIYIIGLVRDVLITRGVDSSIRNFNINLFDKFHCYDLLRGHYLGFGNKLKSKAGPFTHNVFVLIPYQVKAVDINGKKLLKCGQTASFDIALKSDTDKFAEHTMKIEVFDPNGIKKEAYSGICFSTTKGTCRVSIPFALNDKTGEWTISVTDVMTGVRQEYKFKMEKAKK